MPGKSDSSETASSGSDRTAHESTNASGESSQAEEVCTNEGNDVDLDNPDLTIPSDDMFARSTEHDSKNDDQVAVESTQK